MIFVENMVNKIEANNFFRSFFDYFSLFAEEERSKKSFVLRVNHDQRNYLEKSKIPGVKVTNKIDDKIEI